MTSQGVVQSHPGQPATFWIPVHGPGSSSGADASWSHGPPSHAATATGLSLCALASSSSSLDSSLLQYSQLLPTWNHDTVNHANTSAATASPSSATPAIPAASREPESTTWPDCSSWIKLSIFAAAAAARPEES